MEEENEYAELNFAQIALCLQGLNTLKEEIDSKAEESEE